MSAPDQALFAALKARFAADSGGSGLATLAKPGGFVRQGDETTRSKASPRIEVDFEPFADMGLCGIKAVQASVTLIACEARERALGTGDTPEASGTIDAIVERIILEYDGFKPSLTGWSASTIDTAIVATVPQVAGQIRRAVRLTLTMTRN